VTEGYVLAFAQKAMVLGLMLAGPALIVSMLVGSLVSLFQAATQIHEVTLNFVPKILAIGLVLLLLGSWMGQQLLSFTSGILIGLPDMPR
jgi:flagellar biosynthetic protein FliQ